MNMGLPSFCLHRRACLAWAVGGGCAQSRAQTPPKTLTVSAAASLGDAMRALAPAFEAEHPSLRLRWNFAASGVLLQQLMQGAPVDVFVSADEDSMDRAAAQQLIEPATRRVLASNQLVMVAPARSSLSTLSGLSAVRRIAIGKAASVPAGRYAQQALQAVGLWQPLRSKLVPADNVRQVLDYVVRGEVDAGFVYATDVASAGTRVRVVTVLSGHTPIRYPMAVVRGSAQPQAAGAFVQFLASPPAQAVLKQRGFGAP